MGLRANPARGHVSRKLGARASEVLWGSESTPRRNDSGTSMAQEYRRCCGAPRTCLLSARTPYERGARASEVLWGSEKRYLERATGDEFWRKSIGGAVGLRVTVGFLIRNALGWRKSIGGAVGLRVLDIAAQARRP